jgi:hypothetical protein
LVNVICKTKLEYFVSNFFHSGGHDSCCHNHRDCSPLLPELPEREKLFVASTPRRQAQHAVATPLPKEYWKALYPHAFVDARATNSCIENRMPYGPPGHLNVNVAWFPRIPIANLTVFEYKEYCMRFFPDNGPIIPPGMDTSLYFKAEDTYLTKVVPKQEIPKPQQEVPKPQQEVPKPQLDVQGMILFFICDSPPTHPPHTFVYQDCMGFEQAVPTSYDWSNIGVLRPFAATRPPSEVGVSVVSFTLESLLPSVSLSLFWCCFVCMQLCVEQMKCHREEGYNIKEHLCAWCTCPLPCGYSWFASHIIVHVK